MQNRVIQARGISRLFETYQKPKGFRNSLKGFLNRKYVQKIALQPTDLDVDEGKIIGLVGANGAGKTTLLKLLSGLVHPSSGELKVLGYTPHERKADFLKQISLLLGKKNQLWWDIPPIDSYRLLTRIYELDPLKSEKRVYELTELLDCRDQLNTQLRRLSLGERMKMEIIGSLLHNPRILFLDEPTIGLDIIAQNAIRKFLGEYVKIQRPTIFLTSHYMDDISQLSDRLLLMKNGQIVYDGTVDEFSAEAEAKQVLSFRFTKAPEFDVAVNPEVVFKADELVFKMKVTQGQVVSILAHAMKVSEIADIKIEESDFEDTIREFMEKGRGISQAFHPNPI